jgi:hypothetical protein
VSIYPTVLTSSQVNAQFLFGTTGAAAAAPAEQTPAAPGA